MVNLTGIQQKTVFPDHLPFIRHGVLVGAAAGSLWLSIDPLFICSVGRLPTPILVGWLVLPTISLGGRRQNGQ
jgi:hypothetical protein